MIVKPEVDVNSLRGCAQKHRYLTAAAARDAVKKAKRRSHRSEHPELLDIYKCRTGADHWHIGHNPFLASAS